MIRDKVGLQTIRERRLNIFTWFEKDSSKMIKDNPAQNQVNTTADELLYKWEENYNLNIKSIDDQHKELLELINTLYNNTIKDYNADSYVLLDLILDWCIPHFRDEEKILEESEFPLYEEHKKSHRDFEGQIRIIYNEINKGFESRVLLVRFLKLLINWFINHVMTEDKKYAEFLKSRDSYNKNGLNVKSIIF
ncbi:MAG: hemerythrin family protein [Spirochaetota bacterium]|nr:hemerythrin family protein [Spirochaetota bacterium]